MWANDVRQGNGALITIDGVFYEGYFDKDRLVVSIFSFHVFFIKFNAIASSLIFFHH